jgi:hypothetical protein
VVGELLYIHTTHSKKKKKIIAKYRIVYTQNAQFLNTPTGLKHVCCLISGIERYSLLLVSTKRQLLDSSMSSYKLGRVIIA